LFPEKVLCLTKAPASAPTFRPTRSCLTIRFRWGFAARSRWW
jgi:hypothetical protein